MGNKGWALLLLFGFPLPSPHERLGRREEARIIFQDFPRARADPVSFSL